MQTLGERVDRATKEIKELAKGTRLAGRKLARVAQVYERYNYPTARTFVEGMFADTGKASEQEDLGALLQIMEVIERNKLPKPVASYIIKKLEGIKRFGEEVK